MIKIICQNNRKKTKISQTMSETTNNNSIKF